MFDRVFRSRCGYHRGLNFIANKWLIYCSRWLYWGNIIIENVLTVKMWIRVYHTNQWIIIFEISSFWMLHFAWCASPNGAHFSKDMHTNRKLHHNNREFCHRKQAAASYCRSLHHIQLLAHQKSTANFQTIIAK